MTLSGLLDHLRMRLFSMGIQAPFDPLLITYIDNAYKSFVNGIGGVPDEEIIEVVAGTDTVTIPSYVLKIKSAALDDGTFIQVVNRADTRLDTTTKYGAEKQGIKFGESGEIRYLMIGVKRGEARVAGVPLVNTNVVLDVDRIPKTTLTSLSDTTGDVGDVWQLNMLDGAIAMSMRNHENANVRAQSAAFDASFNASIQAARKEQARAKSKVNRIVRYGGY